MSQRDYIDEMLAKKGRLHRRGSREDLFARRVYPIVNRMGTEPYGTGPKLVINSVPLIRWSATISPESDQCFSLLSCLIETVPQAWRRQAVPNARAN
jgi:hypothetical protein